MLDFHKPCYFQAVIGLSSVNARIKGHPFPPLQALHLVLFLAWLLARDTHSRIKVVLTLLLHELRAEFGK
jgi:hypothetical protein